MQLPTPRGPLSEAIFPLLLAEPGSASMHWVDPRADEDEQVTLWALQQLSYRRIDRVDPAWEEDPGFLTVRHRLERRMEDRLRDEVGPLSCAPDELPEAIRALIDGAEGPSLSGWVLERAGLDHVREFVVHRAAYQLQEADPHTFAVPRLEASEAKTALLQLQLDEYGGHEPTEAHALLFVATMEALGLAPEADVDLLPATTLATNTLLNLFGRSRRFVPACLGHLAVFEMTSVEPMARYAAALRRLLPDPTATAAARFYDVHVAADGLHGTIATDRLLRGFAELHPDECDDVLFGAAALLSVERAFAESVIRSWERGTTSLRAPLPGATLAPPRHLAAAS